MSIAQIFKIFRYQERVWLCLVFSMFLPISN